MSVCLSVCLFSTCLLFFVIFILSEIYSTLQRWNSYSTPCMVCIRPLYITCQELTCIGSVVDPDSKWICIQQLSGPGFVFRIRIRIGGSTKLKLKNKEKRVGRTDKNIPVLSQIQNFIMCHCFSIIVIKNEKLKHKILPCF